MKKLSIYLSMFIGFLFCFIFSKNINILAYKSSTIDNVFGSYPVQMDIDNYDRSNLFPKYYTIYNSGVSSYSYDYTTNLISYSTSSWSHLDMQNVCLNAGIYTFSITNGYDSNKIAGIWVSNGNIYTTNSYVTFTFNSFSCTQINIDIKENTSGTFGQFTLVKGNIPNYNYTNFIFGYRVSICANSTSNFSSNVSFNASNSNYNFSRSGYFSVSANSSNCVSDIVGQNVVPFNVDENGFISLENTTFNISFTNTSGTLSNGYYIQLTPILNGYYKGEYTTNLYSLNRYTYNNLIINGANLESNNPSIGYITTNNPNTFNYNLNDLKNTINVIYYNNVSEVKQNNVITINEYINRGFIIGLNSNNISTLNNTNLIFSFSGISTYISGELSTNSPLPDNPNTIDKYNSCSAWYDIPCQLGNAITYVIYEAPIISPIINFFDGLIEPLKQFIRLIDQFSGFGILFGLGITAMLICIIKKMYGGGES